MSDFVSFFPQEFFAPILSKTFTVPLFIFGAKNHLFFDTENQH